MLRVGALSAGNGGCAAHARSPATLEERKSTNMYLIAFPLLLIPFALYNMIAFLLNMPFTDVLFNIPLVADQRMPVATGDLLVAIGMLLIYIEVLKARFGSKAAMDHVLSFILFAAMASELVLVPRVATPTLLLLTVLGFVDVITGISVSARAKPPEIALEGADHQRM
jgi:hypothetical protein